MQSINIYEKGISYLNAVLSVYAQNCAYFVLYILGLIYIFVKGTKRDKEIFLPQAILLILTVYNPLFAYFVNRFFDINNEYYRLFWIAPVALLVSYIVAGIVSGVKNTGEKGIVVVLILLIGLTAGNFVYADGYNRIENIYQIPDELIEITEIIHENASQEYPKAFFEYEYNMQVRQYDPKIRLTIDREDYLRAVVENYPEDMINDDEHPQYRILAALVRGQEVDTESLRNALELTKTEYVVISSGNTAERLLEDAGLSVIAKTDGHIVYGYDVQEPYIYELLDYENAPHDFCYRRLK